MADNIALPPVSGDSKKAATDAVTYSGDSADVQLMRLVDVVGSEGSKTTDSVWSRLSSANSSTATLLAAAQFVGTAIECIDFAEIQVNVIASHASAADGLAIQQSSDGTNWDIIDSFTVPAATGKVFSVQVAARHARVVYTNGGTNQSAFRLQTFLRRVASKGSSQRPSDALSNENDFAQVWAINSVYNGSTWDRARGDTSGNQRMVGNVAHDAGDSGDPVKVGSRAISDLAGATMVSAGDRVDQMADLDGALVVRPQAPLGNILSERVSNTDGNSTAFSTFGATASTRNYVSSFTVYNDSTTNGYVDIRDGTGGSVLMTIPLPAKGGAHIPLPTPLRQPTANTALAYDVSAALTTVYITVIGFKSKA